MRIFNWVQRRLNPNNFRESRLGRSSVKKDECLGNGSELESWKDGILTIGTFGYDPLKHFPQHDHHQQLFPEVWTQEEEEDVDYDDDDEDDNDINNHNNVDSGELDEEELNPLIFSKASDDDVEYEEYPISSSMRKNDHSSPADTYDEITKRRTTLADLFVAESSSTAELLTGNNKLTVVLSNHIDVAGEKKKKKKKETRSSPHQQCGGLADKFVHSVGGKVEDDDHGNPRPVKIKKLHRLMKKILKKKIYPEDVSGAPVINQKKHVQAAAAQHESLCLLHTGAAVDTMP